MLSNQELPCYYSSPCQNGATCVNNGLGGYSCTCATGYTGTYCQYSISFFILKNLWIFLKNSFNLIFYLKKALPCTLANPCKNGAACANNNTSGYTCTCASGYTGTNCTYGM